MIRLIIRKNCDLCGEEFTRPFFREFFNWDELIEQVPRFSTFKFPPLTKEMIGKHKAEAERRKKIDFEEELILPDFLKMSNAIINSYEDNEEIFLDFSTLTNDVKDMYKDKFCWECEKEIKKQSEFSMNNKRVKLVENYLKGIK